MFSYGCYSALVSHYDWKDFFYSWAEGPTVFTTDTKQTPKKSVLRLRAKIYKVAWNYKQEKHSLFIYLYDQHERGINLFTWFCT